ncbi:MAG: protein kinase [Lentisphaeria bacterium]|nr:protein kinase [Lentisphaeria bacterium]
MEGAKKRPEIPDFVLIRHCGQGGSSEVWLGSDRHGCLRAVRMVSKQQPPTLLAWERRSLQLYRSLAGTHAHLLPILSFGETAEYLYSIMEPADNFSRSSIRYEPDTLAERIERCMVEDTDSIMNYLDAILDGIEQLHMQNIVHGDLKPENIVFVNKVLKIADTGLISPSNAVPAGGTAAFRPPWPGATGIECDIYAIGKLIYMLCTHGNPARFPEIPSHCRLSDFMPLNEIALGCCERKTHLRFQCVSEIRQALQQISTPGKLRIFPFPGIKQQTEFEQQPSGDGQQQLTEYVRRRKNRCQKKDHHNDQRSFFSNGFKIHYA